MNAQITWELVVNIMLIPVAVWVIVAVARRTGKSRGLFAAFFVYGMIALVLEDIYWVAYDILRPESRMPFAADELAGCAVILLLGSALATRLDDRADGKALALVLSVVFTSVNTALWIAWTHEWFQDIICAIPYVYFMYVLIRGLMNTGAVGQRERLFAVCAISVVLILYIVGSLTDGAVSDNCYNTGLVLMNMITVLLLIKAVLMPRFGCSEDAWLFSSFAVFFYGRLAIYLSWGMFYPIALFLNILTLPVMLKSVLVAEGASGSSLPLPEEMR